MSNLIDLFSADTYPQKFIDIINQKGLEIDYFDVDNIFENSYIKCAHTTRVYDKSTIEQYGLLRPFIVDNNEKGQYHIADVLKSIVFEPYKKYYSEKKLEKMMISYDSTLIKEYKRSNDLPLEDYYGKFSVVHFTYDNIDRVTINDFGGYKNFLVYHGGELLDFKIADLVKNDTIPYVIFFKVRIFDLPNQVRYELYDDMARVYLNKEFIVYPKGYINKDIPSSDIIEIKEVSCE